MTPQEALDLIKSEHKHKFYKQAVKYAEDLSIHADEGNPMDLITKRRPKESEAIQKYREAIHIEKTEAPVSKVQTSLMKIRKSQDWMIKYGDDISSKIAKEEALESYMESNFPKYASFTNWFFDVCFKQYLIDANAVSFVMPTNLVEKNGKYTAKQDNEYYTPYPVIYNSKQIIDYSSEHYILHSEEKNLYKVEKTVKEGDIFYLVDSTFIYELRQINDKNDFKIIEFKHDLGILPIVKLGGIVKKEMKEIILYKSRISPMVPELKEALREYSDLQSEVVQHGNSTLWLYEAQQCAKCGGSGKVIGAKDAAPIQCKECKGKGSYPFNPYEHYVVKKPKAGETSVPAPPAGFISKDISLAELQDKRVENHIYYAYCSINFEFLAKSPTNQSGYAKDVDKSELNNFTHSVAEDSVRIIDSHYNITNEYRYKLIVPNKEERKKLKPTIPVPQKYDILGEEYLLKELTTLKTANVDTSIVNASSIDYANKKFGNDPEMRDYIINCIELDPFASENEDALLMKLQSGGISKTKYTIHCNIKDYIKQAAENDPTFYSQSYKDKKTVIEKMAADDIAKNSAAGKVLSMVDPKQEDEEAA